MKPSSLKPDQEKQGSHFLFGGAIRKWQKTVSSYLLHNRHDFGLKPLHLTVTLFSSFLNCRSDLAHHLYTAFHHATPDQFYSLAFQNRTPACSYTPTSGQQDKTAAQTSCRIGWSGPTTSRCSCSWAHKMSLGPFRWMFRGCSPGPCTAALGISLVPLAAFACSRRPSGFLLLIPTASFLSKSLLLQKAHLKQ